MKTSSGQEMKHQAAEMKHQATETRTNLEQTAANMQRTMVDLEEKLKHHQVEAVMELEERLKHHQDKAVADSESGQELVMSRLKEQRQAVNQALENQYKQIVREELRALGAGERSLTAADAFLDRHSGVVAKYYPHDGKTSWDVYYLQFENITRMNNWSDEEEEEMRLVMLRDSAAAVLENLPSSDKRDYGKITSALKLGFGDAHLTELLYG
nr:unnamed protein product [Callosobruchus chinensis]